MDNAGKNVLALAIDLPSSLAYRTSTMNSFNLKIISKSTRSIQKNEKEEKDI